MSDTPLQQWARWLASEISARAIPEADDIRLQPVSTGGAQPASIQDSILLCPTPGSTNAWQVRIRYVEKAVAKAILSGPVGYSCFVMGGLPENSPVSPTVNVVRLAFGFSLSVGHSCRCRYTAYHLIGGDAGFFVRGNDTLFASSIATTPLNLEDSRLKTAIDRLLGLVKNAALDYAGQPQIRKQLEGLDRSLSAELRELDRLYLAKHDPYAQILGNPAEGSRGEDALDVEYSSRMRDTIEKYRETLLFEPLSLGMIQCNGRVTTSNGSVYTSVPFVEQPFAVDLTRDELRHANLREK